MPYTPTIWENEVPSGPLKYKISQTSDGDVATDASIELVTPVTSGTPFNAANMNKLENAIAAAVSAAEAAEAGSGTRVIQIQVVSETIQVDTTSGVGYFFVPQAMDGMNLIRATAMVHTAGTTNPTTIQIRNLTKYPSNDALSSAISIASGGTIATEGVVNSSYDNVSTNDKIRITVQTYSVTRPYGLWVVLEYQQP